MNPLCGVSQLLTATLGRDNIWGVALPMSGKDDDTNLEFFQFVAANDAGYVTRRLLIQFHPITGRPADHRRS